MKIRTLLLIISFSLWSKQNTIAATKSKFYNADTHNTPGGEGPANIGSIEPKSSFADKYATDSVKYPVHVFCGTGDHLWVDEREPVDSRKSVASMLEWMSKTYGVKRLYWRGGQEGLWQEHFKIGKETVENYDYKQWSDYVYDKQKVNKAVVKSAKRNGMEIFLYDGLFEHGVQPDVGIIGPHLFEDKLRIDHPEWAPLDRWGERRSPGPLSFSYPEVRKILVDRYVNYVVDNGYDGINFYTYVENWGLRYLDEFGFNQPIVDEFNKRYPSVDLRKDKLTDEHKLYWYKCRGKFVTEFIRELHRELEKNGKKLSMILDSKKPEYAQPWWSRIMPGAGMIYLDWETWAEEGIVDEFWVQLGNAKDQQVVLDRLIEKCKDKPVKLTVRTPDPFASYWDKYVAAGVTPIAVITWANNGIEKFSLEPSSLGTLNSKDWKLRLQTLDDIILGKINVDSKSVAPLTKDQNVLVRRKALLALLKIGATGEEAVIESSLKDKESSVRIAAVRALKSSNGPESVQRILNQVARSPIFPYKNASAETLGSIGEKALPILVYNLDNRSSHVREVCVRSISNIKDKNFDSIESLYNPLRGVLNNNLEDYRVRWWAVRGLLGLNNQMSVKQREEFVFDLIGIINSTNDASLQMQAATALGEMNNKMSQAQREISLKTLAKLFHEYGDNSSRVDAAFGWRIVGNSIRDFGTPGMNILEQMRKQTSDKWLAWVAYEVLYVFQKATDENTGFNLIDEDTAINNHNKFAPTFPGWRKW